MLALLAALLLSTARAATPEAGVQEDASIAIETPAKVVRHFDGSLRIGYADPLDLGQGSSFMESLAARLEESLRGAGKGGADVSVTLHMQDDARRSRAGHEQPRRQTKTQDTDHSGNAK